MTVICWFRRVLRLDDHPALVAAAQDRPVIPLVILDPAEVADAAPFPAATPLNGPGWFQCYSAKALTADLEAGNARAILGQAEVHPDVDRIIAVYPDGRAFGWHQLNDKTPERGVMD